MADVFLSYPLSFFISLLLITNVLIPSKSSVLASTLHSFAQIGEDSLPGVDVTDRNSDLLNENVLGPTDKIADKVRKNLFVLTMVSKSECFVGEPVIVTYKLYSRLNAKSSIVSQPKLTGFSKHELIQAISLIGSKEKIGGKIYQVYILKKTQLVPVISGKVALDPIELEHTINFTRYDEDSLTAGTQLTDFIQKKKTEEHKEVTIRTNSSSVNLLVRDLPEKNKPANFTGAIGSFSIQAKITGKPIDGGNGTLIVEIKGKGNLAMTDPPTVQFPTGIEPSHLPPSIASDNVGPDFKTSRLYEYPVLFRQSGAVQIPPVSFSYFEPGKQIYKTIYAMPISINVHQNPKKSAVSAPRQQQPSAAIPKTATNIFPGNNWVFIGLIAIAGIIGLFWKKIFQFGRLIFPSRKKSRLKIDDQSTPLCRAGQKLKNAKAMLDAKDFATFYAELNKALWASINEKISLLPADVNRCNVFAQLGLQGWTPEDKWNLELTMNEYDRNLYVPGYQDESNYESAYENALQIITKLNQLTPVRELIVQSKN